MLLIDLEIINTVKLNVSSNAILNSTSIYGTLNVSGVSSFNSITSNKKYVGPTGWKTNASFKTLSDGTPRVGIPQSYLHLGNYETGGSSPVIVFGKNNGGYRNAYLNITISCTL